MTISTTRRQEQPSGHARLEQRLGKEGAGVVCWQKPPGHTGKHWRRCRFFTARCNKRWRRSIGQEADGRVAVPPSFNGLVGLLYERSPTSVKRPKGPRMTSPMRRRTTRTLTRTKTMTGTTRPATPSSSPLPQRTDSMTTQCIMMCRMRRRDWTDASAPRAMTPAKQGQRYQCDADGGTSQCQQ